MKPKKFSEIYFQPFMILAELLEKAFPDCCLRRPCNKEHVVDENMNYPLYKDSISILDDSALFPEENVHYMLTHDRVSYVKEGDAFIDIFFGDNFSDIDDNTEIYDVITIDFGFINPEIIPCINCTMSIDKQDIKLFEEMSCWRGDFSISRFDNPEFISVLHDFILTKFSAKKELCNWMDSKITEFTA